jgi:protein O-mannosyl-transferase
MQQQPKKDRRQKNIAAKRSQHPKHSSSGSDKKSILPILCILVISFIAYLPVLKNGFVNLDDDKYILNNPMITSINISQIFSEYVQGNFHPLTMLVYAVEYSFFGVEPHGYHLVNLFLHLLNIILVFRIVILLSGKKEIAIVAALLFGIHPLHVESVAWASELKDLLYSFFFLASWLFYLKWLERSEKRFFAWCMILFLLALLAKAMAASLPLVFLLTDYFKGRRFSAKTWLEKIPFIVLAVLFGIVAIAAQRSGGAIQDLDYFPFLQRITFACYGFVTYLIKLVLPTGLSAYYPYPVKTAEGIPGWYYLYPLVLAVIIFFIFYSLRFGKKIFFAFSFFAITVFLVLQLLPVGNTIMADRYTYIPSMGIFYLAGEGFYWLWTKKKNGAGLKWIAGVGGILAIIIFSALTFQRSAIWKDSLSLWNDVIEKNKTIPTAHNNRGMALEAAGKMDEALSDYDRAIELQPDFDLALNNRANILMGKLQYDKALGDYNKAIQLKPGFAEAYNGRGVLFMRQKNFPEAMSNFKKALSLKQDYREVYYNLAISEYNYGMKTEACEHLKQAMALGMQQAFDLSKQICQ